MNTAYAIDAEGYLSHEVMGDFDPTGLVLEPPPATLVRPRWNGKSWVESASNKSRATATDQVRIDALLLLSREAERVRELIRPLQPYAMAVQEQKLREARALLQGCCKEEPVVLAAEAAAAGLELKALAAQVLEAHAVWGKQMGQIEAILRRFGDRLRKERERATLLKVQEAGRAALWALVTGVEGSAAAASDDEQATEDTRATGLSAEAAEVAIKEAAIKEAATLSEGSLSEAVKRRSEG